MKKPNDTIQQIFDYYLSLPKEEREELDKKAEEKVWSNSDYYTPFNTHIGDPMM